MSRDLHPAVLKEKTYQPEKWSNFHRYIVLLEVAGKRPGQIADIVGVSNARVSVILNDARADLDRVQLGGAIADRMTDITSKLEMYAHESLDIIMEEILRDAEIAKAYIEIDKKKKLFPFGNTA